MANTHPGQPTQVLTVGIESPRSIAQLRSEQAANAITIGCGGRVVQEEQQASKEAAVKAINDLASSFDYDQ